MGRGSTKEDKSIYQIARENAKLTRASASEALEFITESRIEKIENGANVHPEEVLAMAKAYNTPSLCNKYCTEECAIGKKYIPKIEEKDLASITLEMLNTINNLNEEKNRLIEITVDGEITKDEMKDFNRIKENLDKMSKAIDSLKLWIEEKMDL